MCIGLPGDVQKDLAAAYWQVFTDSSMCHIDTLRALDQCVPSDDETAMIESYVEAFTDSKLAEAEKFMLHVSRVPRFTPWLHFLSLRNDLQTVADEIAPVFQGHLFACQQLTQSNTL